MNELLSYVFSPLREGDIALYRGSGDGLAPILLVAAEGTSPERLEHEHALKSELDADWAVRPVALTHYNGRRTLVLEDPGGAPLETGIVANGVGACFIHDLRRSGPTPAGDYQPGGRLWATANVPHGATFHLVLPVHQEDASS